ncbi:MAG: indole-3-glycerol phosphate synthase TrpC [Dissulfurispiraceae bacterium]|jgi:indole-3-glycerol phosphate synthase|nr:indole-3-glycerol phosphate synthase TrpC [Dissulfurispiraceae bacterium]
MNILNKIVAAKKIRIAEAKTRISESELKQIIKDTPAPLDFPAAIKSRQGAVSLIAEIKKASPSKGLIRPVFDPAEIASIYEECPVNAISVLTEEDYFQGRLDNLKIARRNTKKPLLKKDFIFDKYQIYEARANQADAVLLIASILEVDTAKEYINLAYELGLSVLFETHDEDDMEKALLANAQMIGINNRNLKTMQIDINTTLRLMKMIPEDRIVVSESGIETSSDVKKLINAGVDAMLIGTSIMKTKDISSKIAGLLRAE